MGGAKRIFLFLAVNVLIVVTISAMLTILGIRPYLSERGINLQALAIFCLAFGMGGAFISLAISRKMAKWMMGVKVVDPETRDAGARWLVDTVHRLAKQAGLEKMPEVGIYPSGEVNAFATGPTRNRSIVAVSQGLLQRMERDQIEGVLGHEVAHIANGDMVTMTLVQGVINAIVMFVARIIAWVVASNVREESRFMVHIVVTIVLEIALSVLGMIVVAWFSRMREYRADAGGAALAGRQKMIGALEGLRRHIELVQNDEHESVQTLKINGGKPGGLKRLFMTHPPLEERIRRLQQQTG